MDASTRPGPGMVGGSAHLPGRWAAALAFTYLVAATMFAVGEPFGELGSGRALVTTSIWVLPTILLTGLALSGRHRAGVVAVVAAVAVIVVQAVFQPVDADRYGPVTAFAALAAAWPVTMVGLRRPRWAARAMLALGSVLLVATALARGPRASTLAVALPLLLLAGAFELTARAR